jgi:hypothetical protein
LTPTFKTLESRNSDAVFPDRHYPLSNAASPALPFWERGCCRLHSGDAIMTSASKNILKTIPPLMVVSVILAACLFRDALGSVCTNPLWQQALEVVDDSGVQWIIAICVGSYALLFTFLQCRRERLLDRSRLQAQVLFSFGLGLGVFTYVMNYHQASSNTLALVLFTGAAIGKGTYLFCSSRANTPGTAELRVRCIIIIFLLLLVTSAVWHPRPALDYWYRGMRRSAGPWDSPNIFGCLMGTGAVLAAALFLRCLLAAEERCKCRYKVSSQVYLLWWSRLFLYLAGTIFLGGGLLSSYSRGAWLATCCGSCWLFTALLKQRARLRSGTVNLKLRNWLPVILMVISFFVMALWLPRATGATVARRVASLANINDFSWRNRIGTWSDALRMTADRPLLGCAWDQPERHHDELYRAARLAEGSALGTNSYFVLSAAIGLPGVACLFLYFGMSLFGQQPTNQCELQSGERANAGAKFAKEEREWTFKACRAGALVLAVGFWFDGGLFKLAVAGPFWLFLELGNSQARQTASNNVHDDV